MFVEPPFIFMFLFWSFDVFMPVIVCNPLSGSSVLLNRWSSWGKDIVKCVGELITRIDWGEHAGFGIHLLCRNAIDNQHDDKIGTIYATHHSPFDWFV